MRIAIVIVNSHLYCASYNACNDRWCITSDGNDSNDDNNDKMLSYRRETALQGALVLAKSAWKTGTERGYFTDIIGLSSTTAVI